MEQAEANKRYKEAQRRARAGSIAKAAEKNTRSFKDQTADALNKLAEQGRARQAALLRRTAAPHWVSVPTTERHWRAVLPEYRLALADLIVGQAPWPLVLCGETGSGKTCAALCLHDYFGGWYTTLADLHALRNDVLAERLFWGGVSDVKVRITEFWETWSKHSVCTIDEIGVRSPTDAQYETLKTALDRREARPLIVVSNLTVAELDDLYDNRVASRLASGTVLEMKGDWRVEQAKGAKG